MLDAEQTLITMVLHEPHQLESVIGEGVMASSFFRDDCRELWNAIITSPQKNGVFDPAQMIQRLPTSLMQTAVEYISGEPFTQNIVSHAREVVTADKSRRAALLASRVAQELANRKPHDPLEPILARFESELSGLKVGDSEAVERSSNEVIGEVIDHFELLINGTMPPRITTGYGKLDAILGGGFERGRYAILAARTGVGKTTAALWMASSAAIAGHRTLYVTVEMSARQLLSKAIASHGSLSLSKFHTPDWTQHDQDNFHIGANKVVNSDNLFFFDNTRRSIERVISRAKFMKRTGKLDLLVIDYIQQFKTSRQFSKRNEMMMEISAQMQQLAKELDIAILCLAQLNRDATRSDFPSVHQIKDCGEFEQDADTIILLHKFLGEDNRPTGTYTMIAEKVRDGRSNVRFNLEDRHDIGRLVEINDNNLYE